MPHRELVADRVVVRGNLELDDGFRAHGTVRLPNAEVGGYLRLSGAELGRPESSAEGGGPDGVGPGRDTRSGNARVPVALLGDGMEIGGDLETRDDGRGPLCVHGQLRVIGARIVNLGPDGYFRPSGASQRVSAVVVAAGWILASTAAAGAARVLKRG